MYSYICGDDLRSNAPGQARPGLNQRLQMKATRARQPRNECTSTGGDSHGEMVESSAEDRWDGWMDGQTDRRGWVSSLGQLNECCADRWE